MQKRQKKTTKEERICSICSQSFTKAEHLHRHMRSHTQEKPFGCSVCGRKYSRHDTLLRHSRVHQSRRQERNGEPQASPGSVAARSHGSSTSVSAGDSACLSTAVTAAEHVPGPSAFGTTPQQQQLQLPNKNSNNGAMAVPNGYSVDGSRNSLDTIVASYSPITMPLAIVRENTPQSMIGHDARQCNLIPSWSPDGSLQWPPFDPFLATEEMDLEELSLSLLNATGEYPLQPVTIDAPISPAVSVGQCDTDLASDNTHTAPGQATVVQRSWHTFSGHAPSGYVTPNSHQEHDRLDDACHKNLEDRLQPRLQRGTLPSASFLDLCVQAYFTNFQPILPIIHAPTFKPHARNGLLLLSICCVGSLFLGSTRATSHGISLFERLNKAVLTSWDTIIAHPKPESYTDFQATVIGQIFGFLVGRPKDLMQIDLFHGSLVVWARKLKLFQVKSTDFNISGLDGQALDTAWKKWVGEQEKKRTVLALLLLDAEIARFFHHEPVIRHSLDQLSCIELDEAFAARSATGWKSIIIEKAASRPTNDSQATPLDPPSRNGTPSSSFPDVLSGLGLCVMLERIGSMASERPESASQQSQRALECQELLVSWFGKYRCTAIFQAQAPGLMMLWHSTFMLLNMDLDALECAAGREGNEEGKKYQEEAEAWARSSRARKCIVHSVLVQRQFERMRVGTVPPIHAPACLYRCGIAWYCYARFGAGIRPVPEDRMKMPELEPLEIDGNRILLEDVALHVGKPLEPPVLRTVDLLQRISHWKVAEKLASTLLALVDDGQSLY